MATDCPVISLWPVFLAPWSLRGPGLCAHISYRASIIFLIAAVTHLTSPFSNRVQPLLCVTLSFFLWITALMSLALTVSRCGCLKTTEARKPGRDVCSLSPRVPVEQSRPGPITTGRCPDWAGAGEIFAQLPHPSIRPDPRLIPGA